MYLKEIDSESVDFDHMLQNGVVLWGFLNTITKFV
jgi:hypothetical protein